MSGTRSAPITSVSVHSAPITTVNYVTTVSTANNYRMSGTRSAPTTSVYLTSANSVPITNPVPVTSNYWYQLPPITTSYISKPMSSGQQYAPIYPPLLSVNNTIVSTTVPVVVSTAYNAITSASVLFTGASVVTSSDSAAGYIMSSQRLNSTGTVPRTATPALLHKQLSFHEDRIHRIQKKSFNYITYTTRSVKYAF
jgi:hypothetical protein